VGSGSRGVGDHSGTNVCCTAAKYSSSSSVEAVSQALERGAGGS